MKILRGLVFTLFALLLTGCYTQLQYTQKMKKVTDRPQRSAAVYSSDDQQEPAAEAEAENMQYDEQYANYNQQDEDYVPVYYKDYEYARKYEECGCNPYNVYNFYGYDSYDYYPYSYNTMLTLDPFYFHRWHHYYGPRYYRPYWGTSLSLSFYWGTPYYHSFYYDPFFYDYYWNYYWGYPRSYAFNYIYFYGNYGHGYYGHKDFVNRQNVRYGPRSIGTDRVRSDATRSRDGRSASVRGSSDNTRPDIRTRTIGTSRTRGSASGSSGTVGSPRSRGTTQSGAVQSGDSRSRSRVDATRNSTVNRSRVRVQSDRSRPAPNRVIRSREIDNNHLRRITDPSQIRRNLDDQRAPRIRVNPNNVNSRHRSSFFQRMKGFFERGAVQLGRNIGNSGSTVRFNSRPHSRTRSSAVSRSNGHSRSSTVSRSRSSSSQTRSRSGSSSRSRSSSSNSSDRSRGNN